MAFFGGAFVGRASKAYLKAMQKHCESQTLKKSMQVSAIELPSGPDQAAFQVQVYMPQYWARYFHDGRKGFRASPGKALAFWGKGATHKDPRIAGGYPIKRSQIKSLRAFWDAAEFNKHKKNDKDFILIHHNQGGVAASTGKPFKFSAWRDFRAWLALNLPAEVQRLAREALAPLRRLERL